MVVRPHRRVRAAGGPQGDGQKVGRSPDAALRFSSGGDSAPVSKLGDWTHGTCPRPRCSLSEPPRRSAPLLPAPTALPLQAAAGPGSHGVAARSCFVSAFLWWTLFWPRCRAVRWSGPALKFLKVPYRASCRHLSMRRGRGSSPRGPCRGNCREGWEARCPPSGRSGPVGVAVSALRVPRPPPSWPAPLFPQMSKVWNDLQPKLRCLFVGPHGAPAPPRPPQDGPSAH